MFQPIGRGPAQSHSFRADNHGAPGAGGGRLQRPVDLPAGGPDRVPDGRQGPGPGQLGGGFDRLVQDGFDGAGRGRPVGLPAGAPSEKPEGVNGPPADFAGGHGAGQMRPYGLPEGAPSEKPEGVNGPPADLAGGRSDGAVYGDGLPSWAELQHPVSAEDFQQDNGIVDPDPLADIRQLMQTLRAQNVQG